MKIPAIQINTVKFPMEKINFIGLETATTQKTKTTKALQMTKVIFLLASTKSIHMIQ